MEAQSSQGVSAVRRILHRSRGMDSRANEVLARGASADSRCQLVARINPTLVARSRSALTAARLASSKSPERGCHTRITIKRCSSNALAALMVAFTTKGKRS